MVVRARRVRNLNEKVTHSRVIVRVQTRLTSAPKNMKRSSLEDRLSADLTFTTPFTPPNLPLIFWLMFSASVAHEMHQSK